MKLSAWSSFFPCSTACGFAFAAMSAFPFAFTPASFEITSYSAPGNPSSKYTVETFADGMGRTILSLSGDGNGDVVRGTLFDPFGRPVKSVKPYFSYDYNNQWQPGRNIEDEANSYFAGGWTRPNAGGKAYSEKQYLADPLGRIAAVGEPGYEFSLAKSNGVNAAKTWFFAVAGTACIQNPTEATLNAKADEAGAIYRLVIKKNANGKFFQAFSDRLGRLVRKCSDPSATSADEIVTDFEYDHLGNVTKVKYPGPSGAPDASMAAVQAYTSGGQKVSETYPDEGTIETVFDRSGRLRFSRNEKQRIPSDLMAFSYTKYDAFGRIIEQGEVAVFEGDFDYYFSEAIADQRDFPTPPGIIVKPFVRNFYDSNEGAAEFLGMDQSYFFGSNLKGRLVGRVSSNRSLLEEGEKVLETFSYDAEGRLAGLWKIIPGIPVQRMDYTYDLQGRVLTKEHTRGAIGSPAITSAWRYGYDAIGRPYALERMLPDGSFQPMVTYQYSSTGEMIIKDFHKDGAYVGGSDFMYNIRGWLQHIDGFSQSAWVYGQENSYNEPTGNSPPQFNGNISNTHFTYQLNPATKKEFQPMYYYDGVNRLVAAYDLKGPSYEYEGYQYDSKSRLVYKKEDGVMYGPYNYGSGTNRVTHVNAHPSRAAAGTFVYDPNGNMVLDRSKKMAIQYDWRGLPILFRFYSALPGSVGWDQALNLANKQADVEMLYDATGNRVLKRTVRY